MNSNNYVTLSNYTGYLKTISANIMSSIYYPNIPNAYEIIIKNDDSSKTKEKSSEENFARLGYSQRQ